MLINYLASRDCPCPSCAYNLRGLTATNCPECNLALTLVVRLSEPRLGSFITTVVALSAGFGFNAMLFLYFLLFVMTRGVGLRRLDWISLPISAFILGVLLYVVLRMRGRFARWSLFMRIVVPIAAIAFTLVSCFLFFVLVR